MSKVTESPAQKRQKQRSAASDRGQMNELLVAMTTVMELGGFDMLEWCKQKLIKMKMSKEQFKSLVDHSYGIIENHAKSMHAMEEELSSQAEALRDFDYPRDNMFNFNSEQSEQVDDFFAHMRELVRYNQSYVLRCLRFARVVLTGEILFVLTCIHIQVSVSEGAYGFLVAVVIYTQCNLN